MRDTPLNQQLALEMAMQDVMDNMEELALDFGFAGGEACFEILAIEAADIPDAITTHSDTHFIRSPFSAEIQAINPSRQSA
jgi:hypothetical protein